MRPFPLLRLHDENPPAGAQKWRAVCVQSWNGDYMSVVEFKFLQTAGDAAQPGTGTASSSATAGGTGASAFDDNLGTEVYVTWNSGSNFLEYDFNLQWDIREILYTNRNNGSFANQAPRELSIQAFIGGVWTEKGHIYGIPQWPAGVTRRYPVSVPADEAGGHRYWRFMPTSTWGGSPATEIEVEFLQADGTNIGLRANALPSNPNGQGYNALDGVKTGDNYCNFNSPPSATPLSVDFGYKRVVDHIAITCRSGFLNQAVKDGRIDWSDDNATWTEYMTFHGTGTAPTANQTRTFFRGVPVSVSAPLITGTSSTYGNLLTVDNGVWENSPSSFTKTWKKGAGTVLAVGDTYTPVVGDNNSLLRVETVAHNSIGDSTVTTSYVYIGGTQARYWRIRMPYGMRSDGYGSCATLELRSAPGAADLTQGAGRVYSVDLQYGSQTPGLAFDNNAATYASVGVSLPATGHWIAVDLGAGHDAHVGHVTYQAEPSCGDCAHKGFVLEYSSDGTTWATEWDTGPLAGMANGQVLTYTKPAPLVATAPAITGDLSNYGNLLTCGDGVWKNSPTSYVKTWKDHTGTAVSVGNTYTPLSTDYHTVMTCEVAATNDIGTTTYIISFYVGTRVRSSNINGNATSSVAVTWPTGTVAGDLVILFVETAWAPNLPSGWTSVNSQAGSGIGGAIYSKVMTSADITAGGVTVTMTGAYGCNVAAVACYGAPTVNSPAATRVIASGGTVTLTSALAGDEALWYAGVRDGSAGTGTINVGTQLCQGDFGSNQSHGRVTNHPVAANGNEAAIVTHNGQCYFGGLLLR